MIQFPFYAGIQALMDHSGLAGVITPDKKEWHPVEQPPPDPFTRVRPDGVIPKSV